MNDVPGAVHSRNGVAVGAGVFQKSKKVVAGDDTRGDKVIEGSHGELLYMRIIMRIRNRTLFYFRFCNEKEGRKRWEASFGSSSRRRWL
jgi:hypothetical protein